MRKTQLFINIGGDWRELDLYDDIELPINYSVADLTNISEKKTAYSVTFSIPDTNNNAAILGQLDEISAINTPVEMLANYPAFVVCDGWRTFTGYVAIKKVTAERERETFYECSLNDEVNNFFNTIYGETLRGNTNAAADCDFSSGLTLMDENEFVSRLAYLPSTVSVSNTHPRNIVYGFGVGLVDKYDKAGELYGGQRYRTNGSRKIYPWYFEETTPFLYVKDIFDEIFEKAGFCYVSDFLGNIHEAPTLSSSYYPNEAAHGFYNIVYPYANPAPVPTDTQIYSIVFNSDNSINEIETTGTVWDEMSINDTATLRPEFDDQTAQTSINETPSGITALPYLFTAPTTGVYKVAANIPYFFGFWGYDKNFGSYITSNEEIRVNDGGTLYDENTINFYFSFQCIKNHAGNDTTVFRQQISGKYVDAIPAGSHLNAGVYTLGEDVFTGEDFVHLEAGDTLQFSVFHNFSEAYNSLAFPILAYYHLNTSSWRACFQQFFYTIKNFPDVGGEFMRVELVSEYTTGAKFNPSNILKATTKKTDFVASIMKKYNLYIEDVTYKNDLTNTPYSERLKWIDGNGNTIHETRPVLRIEARSVYYHTAEEVAALDWTDRVDFQTITFERPTDYIYKSVIFRDLADKEKYIDEYNNNNYISGEYGQANWYSGFNGLLIEDEEVKTIFGEVMAGQLNPSTTALQVPKWYQVDGSGEIKYDVDFSDRVLFANSLDLTTAPNYAAEEIGLVGLGENLSTTAISNFYTTAQYNFLDTFSAPFGMGKADWNFGAAGYYLQTIPTGTITGNNTFTAFYNDMLEELTDPAARVMTCRMYLTPSDIANITLDRVVIVKDTPFYIMEINEWINGEKPCEVKLLKVIRKISPVPPFIPIEKKAVKGNIINDLRSVQESQQKEVEQLEKIYKDLAARVEKLEKKVK